MTIPRKIKTIAKAFVSSVRREKKFSGIFDVHYSYKIYKFLVLDPKDSIQKNYINHEIYEAEEIDLINKYFKGGGAFVDIGANVGNHSIVIGSRQEVTKLIAFEPNIKAFSQLAFNLAINNVMHKASIYNLALSNKKSLCKLSIPYGNHGGASISEKMPSKGNIESELLVGTEVGDAIVNEKVDFIKIDVEGHEVEVLLGLVKLLKNNKPNLFIEISHRESDDLYHRVEEILTPIGYHEVEKFQRYDNLINYIFTTNNKM